jgi:hypothetical protein
MHNVSHCTGFVPYTGDGFAVLLPSKYNPSKEKEFPGVVLRYAATWSFLMRLLAFAFAAQHIDSRE